MEVLSQIATGLVSAIQWLADGCVAAISDSRYWGGLIAALGGGWILGRVWPRPRPCREADALDEDDWDEAEEDAAAWWVMLGW